MNLPDTNPKTRFGMSKPGIYAIPPVALLHCGAGMNDGCVKYGLTNWREHEVSASVYYNAAFRHMAAWWDGERVASDSGVHHLGHVMACCAILLDAEHMGKLNDDRPAIPGPFSRVVAEMTTPMREVVAFEETDDINESVARWANDLGLSEAEERALDALLEQQQRGETSDMGLMGNPRASAFPEHSYDLESAVSEKKLEAIEDFEERLADDCEEIALRVLSTGNLEDAKAVIRSYLTGGWDDEDDDFGEALGDPLDWGGDEAPMAVGADDKIYVQIKADITHSELETLIRDFLRGDAERKNLATFNNFRRHIGSFQVSGYSQNNRTRLAFYIDATQAGAQMGVYEMDEGLRSAGFEFGSV